MKRMVLVLLLVLASVTLAHSGALTIQTNEEVTLTKCAETWDYEFDCVALNDDVRCVQPPGTDPAIFKGFPSCTAAGMPQTGTEFTGQEPGRIYSVRAGDDEIRFIGVESPLDKPRVITGGGLKITITTNR